MLSVRNIRKSFGGITALDDLSFTLTPDRVTAMVGPNGSGKTTLINVVCGVLEPDAGTVLLNDNEITSLSIHEIARSGIGRAYQRARIFPHVSVVRHLYLALQPIELGTIWSALFFRKQLTSFRESVEDKVDTMLRRIQLTDKRDSRAGSLSHGQKRLLSLGMAMIRSPSVLLLDEPTAGVHPEIIETIKSLISNFCSDEHSVLFIEHDLEFVQDVADRVFVLDNGSLIADGTPHEVRDHPTVQRIYYTPL